MTEDEEEGVSSYWMTLGKIVAIVKEALDRILWRTCFGRGY
jgi:hypothetical protein